MNLTWSECEAAAIAGIHRRLLNMVDGTPAPYGEVAAELWGNDIESCAAELAVAKTLGLYWTPWARRGAEVEADVGENIQVRLRRTPKADKLILHQRDRDDHVFVMVTGGIPTFQVHGWMGGAEAKHRWPESDPYNTGRPCIWVPQDDLYSMDELRESVTV